MTKLIYKIVPEALWADALKAGVFHGAEVDKRDGYIHFSTGAQLGETVAEHFTGQTDLWIVAVDPQNLGESLKFEPSRNDDLFPHLYGKLEIADVEWHRRFNHADCDIVD